MYCFLSQVDRPRGRMNFAWLSPVSALLRDGFVGQHAPPCNLDYEELVGGQCVFKCPSIQVRDPATGQCRPRTAADCLPGTSFSPSTVFPTEGGNCVPTSQPSAGAATSCPEQRQMTPTGCCPQAYRWDGTGCACDFIQGPFVAKLQQSLIADGYTIDKGELDSQTFGPSTCGAMGDWISVHMPGKDFASREPYEELSYGSLCERFQSVKPPSCVLLAPPRAVAPALIPAPKPSSATGIAVALAVLALGATIFAFTVYGTRGIA